MYVVMKQHRIIVVIKIIQAAKVLTELPFHQHGCFALNIDQ